jgi:probable DNA repair protein
LQRLGSQLLAAIERGDEVVVADRQRAAAVRFAYAAIRIESGATSWRSPRVIPFEGWLAGSAALLRRAGADIPRILGAEEERLLWNAAAAGLAADQPLLAAEQLAGGLQRAACLGADAGIGLARLRFEPEVEPRWLAQAAAEVERAAEAWNAAPRHRLVPLLVQAPTPAFAARVLLRGLTAIPAGIARLMERWRSDGADIEVEAPGPAPQAPLGEALDALPCAVSVVSAQDPAAELRLAAAQFAALLASRPRARVLFVVADLTTRQLEVERVLNEALQPSAALDADLPAEAYGFEGGRALDSYAEPAQCLAFLRLLVQPLAPPALQALVERASWLQPDLARRAALARQLAARLAEPLDAIRLEERLGADLAVDAAAAALQQKLAAARRVLGAGSAGAAHWAERFSAALVAAGWPGTGAADTGTQQVRARWAALIAEFAELDPVSERCDAVQATQMLAGMAARIAFAPAAGDAPVLVTSNLDPPVVRYDLIRVCGLTAARWPNAPVPDPYLPVALQWAAAIEDSSAPRLLARAQAQLAAWQSATPQLVLSWAALEDEAEQDPSPLLDSRAVNPAAPTPSLAPRSAQTPAAAAPLALQLRAAATVAFEYFDDDTGLEWPAVRALPQPSRTLDLQNRCAFRGYAEQRLGARQQDLAAPGFAARERGILMHSTLELLWRELRSSQVLVALDADAREALMRRCIAEAGMRLAGTAGTPVDPRTLEREAGRASRILLRLLAEEASRLPFTVHAVEHETEVELGGARMRMRIDRIDRVDDIDHINRPDPEAGAAGMDAGLVVLDYKTGRLRGLDWLGERPEAVQLMLYATALERTLPERVAALANVHLAERSRHFEGAAAAAGIVPGCDALPQWRSEIEHWARRIEALASDFLRADARVDPRPGACRHCHLTAACRRLELLDAAALARGEEDGH